MRADLPPTTPHGDVATAGSDSGSGRGPTWSSTLVAYIAAAFAGLISFDTPVAVVTSFEGEAVRDAAVVVDCRAHLERINPWRRHVWGWAIAVVAVPLTTTVVLVATVLAAGSGSVLGLVLLAPVVGGTVGGLLLRRWATRPGEL